MTRFDRKRVKIVAIKNFDEELYRLAKTYAALEGRTIASIFEEALRDWLESRGSHEEARIWTKLELAYEENMKALEEVIDSLSGEEGKYLLICNGRVVGIFETYEEAARKSEEVCSVNALILELPLKKAVEEIELGFPW